MMQASGTIESKFDEKQGISLWTQIKAQRESGNK